MHKISGLRDPAAAFPLPGTRDDAGDRRAANRAVAVSAAGLGATGLAELLLAVLTSATPACGRPWGRRAQTASARKVRCLPLNCLNATRRVPGMNTMILNRCQAQ